MSETLQTKVLTANLDVENLHEIEVYESTGGYRAARKAALEMSPEQVVEQLAASRLRGRGGAGFSMGKKASFIPKGSMDKFLCCNADESEPGTFKDRLLMQRNPHQLVEGVIIGAIAAGANRAFIFIRGEYELQAQILEKALEEAKAKGYVGERILGSDSSALQQRNLSMPPLGMKLAFLPIEKPAPPRPRSPEDSSSFSSSPSDISIRPFCSRL